MSDLANSSCIRSRLARVGGTFDLWGSGAIQTAEINDNYVYVGNALTDGCGAWFVGNNEFLRGSLRHRENVYLKYSLHHAGQECAKPYTAIEKVSKVGHSF